MNRLMQLFRCLYVFPEKSCSDVSIQSVADTVGSADSTEEFDA